MLSFFKWGVALSFFISLISLSYLIIRTFSFGKKPLYAKPQGDGKKGILYAFGRGMMPWEKESAAKHLPTFSAGLIYHIGIFTALFYLFALILGFELSHPWIFIFRLICFLAVLSGFALFLKRFFLATMKKISCPDDFVANAIVDIFLLLALVHTYTLRVNALFFFLAMVMFLYIPFGKIRHCFFFFYVRTLFGLFYGRRGVLPPKTSKI